MDTSEDTANRRRRALKKLRNTEGTLKKLRKDRGKRFVVYGCGNTTSNSDFVAHLFPDRADDSRRVKAWCRVVSHSRSDFVWTKNAVSICSEHFHDDMTNNVSRQMQKEMLAKAYQKDAKDIKVNWSLADDAIPSVSLLPSKPKHGTPAVTERPRATRSPLTPVPGPSSDIFTTPKLTGSRNAAVIRERKRDVEAADAWKEAVDFQAAIEADVRDDEDGGQESVPCQTKSQFTQVNRRIRRPKHRSMRVQTNYEKPKTKVTVSIGTQTDEKVCSISIIDVKPNVSSSGTPTGTDTDHLPNIATGNCPQAVPSASNEMEDGPGSESSDDESLDDTVDPLDQSYEPAESDISSEEVSDEEFNFIDNENEKDDPHCQTKYLVFHSKLMKLFKICPVCCSPAKRHIRTLGTYLSIKQCRSNKLCSFERFLESQPFINRIPAGNLLLSSAILFTGDIYTSAQTIVGLL
ncbi:uncharacterized protein LOC135488380 [Lineus longissimus]|uniref:uncharacterized protein LOC135488380 n=1 Tax=Lineus longissimus TaxID=88925 RepID=UPI002B4F55AA